MFNIELVEATSTASKKQGVRLTLLANKQDTSRVYNAINLSEDAYEKLQLEQGSHVIIARNYKVNDITYPIVIAKTEPKTKIEKSVDGVIASSRVTSTTKNFFSPKMYSIVYNQFGFTNRAVDNVVTFGEEIAPGVFTLVEQNNAVEENNSLIENALAKDEANVEEVINTVETVLENLEVEID